MIFWICLFVLPIAILTAIFIYLFLRNRSELRPFHAWSAILSGFAAPGFALWGLTHLNVWRIGIAFEPGFERKALLISIAAALFGLRWITRSRHWYSTSVFVISLLIAAFWSTVVLPF
ncbi:MAG TPA: hypothetical protein VME86_07640 [Acidobacteriaceae bacterium]|nr:hypothetical protein [Acidobacteriaceae bacterium]